MNDKLNPRRQTEGGECLDLDLESAPLGRFPFPWNSLPLTLSPQHRHSEIVPSDSHSRVRHCSHPGLPGCKHRNLPAVALSVRRSEDPRHLISSNQASGSYGRLGVVEDAPRRGVGGRQARESPWATLSHLLVWKVHTLHRNGV